MTDKLINPFTKNISFRPSVQPSRPSTTHILESQVTPVMSSNAYPEKYSLNTYNYSNSYTQSYGQSNSYNSLSTQSYQKYNDYSPQKYSDSNLNNLIDKNPFKRTTLLNNQMKSQEPVSGYRHMSSQNWRDVSDSPYIPQKFQTTPYNQKSETTSVYTYINKINDLEDGKSNYGSDFGNPFTRKNLLTKHQATKSREFFMNDTEREYEAIEASSKDYDHLMYKPRKQVPTNDLYAYDSHPKSSKNFQETKKNDIYNYDVGAGQKYAKKYKNYENLQQIQPYEKPYKYDGYNDEKKYTQGKYGDYLDKNFKSQNYSETFSYEDKYNIQRKISAEYDLHDNYDQKKIYNTKPEKSQPYDNKYQKYEPKITQNYEFKDKMEDDYLYNAVKKERKQSDNFKKEQSKNSREIDEQYKYIINKPQFQDLQDSFEQPKFGKNAHQPEQLHEDYSPPKFNLAVQQKSIKTMVKFQSDEEQNVKPTFDSSTPSTLEIRGKIYHQVKIQN